MRDFDIELKPEECAKVSSIEIHLESDQVKAQTSVPVKAGDCVR